MNGGAFYLVLGVMLIGVLGAALMMLSWTGSARESGAWFATGAFIMVVALCVVGAITWVDYQAPALRL